MLKPGLGSMFYGLKYIRTSNILVGSFDYSRALAHFQQQCLSSSRFAAAALRLRRLRGCGGFGAVAAMTGWWRQGGSNIITACVDF